jgi:hypothetical protein
MIPFAFFPIYMLWSLLGVFKIEYSEYEKLIRFQNLLGREKIVSTSDIVGYYQTTFKTGFKKYGGYIFKLVVVKLLKLQSIT